MHKRQVLAFASTTTQIRSNKKHPESEIRCRDVEAFLEVVLDIGSNALVAEDDGFEIFAVQAGDVVDGDSRRAGGFAFAGVGAGTKTFLVHLGDHLQHSASAFRFALRQQ